jgi:FtsP/CotA-like multicopper oxidase with cupredoxin domain
MKRRDFVTLGCAALAQAGLQAQAGKLLPGQTPAQTPAQTQMQMPAAAQNTQAAGNTAADSTKADYTLQIEPVVLELAPSRAISTIGYNGSSPGPLLRVREGATVSVDVVNQTDVPELVHWHGLFVPSDIDGAEEEGTPVVPPHGRRRYQFEARPAGTRWYHTHTMAMADLHRGSYTGQYGFLYIEPKQDPGRYDQEVFLALRDWEPFFADEVEDPDEILDAGPQPEKPATPDMRLNGLEVGSRISSINDKMLGGGDPIRVKAGQRVFFHLLNASAIENRRIALAGHRFQVVALDGNPVPTPQSVEVLLIGPGERIDAFVDMNRPGVWTLGATMDEDRNAGMGVVIEYENQKGQPQWIAPAKTGWDYTIFGKAVPRPAPDHTFEMVFEKNPRADGKFNQWVVNGKAYPHEQEFVLQQGARYRLNFRNKSDDAHPVHIHRHLFEIVDINGKATGGIMKDTVVMPVYGRVNVDLVADQPGLTLFHCHIQQHMDYGFKALFRYS